MPLRRGPDEEMGFSYYEVGTPEELERAHEAIDRLVEDTIAAAERLAAERDVQLAELLDGTGRRLNDRAIELLESEPVWRLSRKERREIRESLSSGDSGRPDQESSGDD